jgi:hypothetical protein
MAKATVAALQDLRRPEDVAKIRGKRISEVLPLPALVAEEEAAAPLEEAALAVAVVEADPAVVEEAPVEEAPAAEAPAEEEPAAEAEPAAEPEGAAEPAAEEAPVEAKPKRRTLRRKKGDS